LVVARRDTRPNDELPRAVLAIGMAGALGDELLAALVASPDYRLVHVALKQAITSGTAKYRPWRIGSSTVAADDAFVCVTSVDTFVPRSSPVEL
jgi:hypothetical protein